jgi:transcriptional regulator with XRE-family HTH domain
MTGADLKVARQKAKWTQQQAATKLGLTQAYLSMLERNHRPVTSKLAARSHKVFELPPTLLPFGPERDLSLSTDDELKSDLGALGYPGFSYLSEKPKRNPAQLLLCSLDRSDLDRRVVEALPWLTCKYVDMDWEWLIGNAKLRDRQNRLGFVVGLAKELADKSGEERSSKKLYEKKSALEHSRLMHEDTLCHESMTNAEREWLQKNRPPEARHWNLLTDLHVRHLPHVLP